MPGPRRPFRAAAWLAGAVALVATVAACGGDGGIEVTAATTRATDPQGEPTTGGSGGPAGPGGSGALGRELAEARRTWEAAGLDDYAVTIRRSCFCFPYSAEYRVVVDDGEVVEVVALDPGDAPLDVALPTVDELFDDIERVAGDDGAEVTALAFDAELGYPTVARLDRVVDAVDDEISWSLSDLVPAGDRGGPGGEAEAAVARWEAAGVVEYSVTVDVTCGECSDPTLTPLRIHVVAGAVTDVRWAEPIVGDVVPPDPSRVADLTVEALLDRIAGDTPASVAFDPLDGHPVLVQWDEPEVLDDEVRVELTGLDVVR